MRYCDIHAHLADPRILPGIDGILADCRRHGVTGILATAARVSEWGAITELSRRAPVYGALGLHPFFLGEWMHDLPERLRDALRGHRRLLAVGEIGLDFFSGRGNQDLQMQVFAAQLSVARDMALPVVLHNRKSWTECFSVLDSLGLSSLRGVCHHFSGSIDTARHALDRGLYLSFCGPLTYANARRLKAAAAYAPLDRILTETDTPDLPAERFRGEHSLPYHVSEVVRELAELKGTPERDVARQVARNFARLLALPPAVDCPG